MNEFESRLRSVLPAPTLGRIVWNTPLAPKTTLRCGGRAPFLELKSPAEALEILSIAGRSGIPVFILGRGSNLVVADGDIAMLFLSVGSAVAPRRESDACFVFGADQKLPGALSWCHEHRLSGMEWSTGIPGSMGGAVRMNAGTKQGEIAPTLAWARVISASGDARKNAPELGLSYRHSSLRDDELVWECAVNLKAVSASEIEDLKRETASYLKLRNETQPLDLPCFGSTFANPPGFAAGKLIEETGLKGLRRGGAMVSTKHANFVVNAGNATAQDVVDLIREVRDRVHGRTGITLRTEVRFAGFQGQPIS